MSTPTGECPTCGVAITLSSDTVASERLECSACHTSYVVASIAGTHASLIVAPAVEEDWGQ